MGRRLNAITRQDSRATVQQTSRSEDKTQYIGLRVYQTGHRRTNLAITRQDTVQRTSRLPDRSQYNGPRDYYTGNSTKDLTITGHHILMMEAETVSETLEIHSIFTGLFVREDFIAGLTEFEAETFSVSWVSFCGGQTQLIFTVTENILPLPWPTRYWHH